MRRSPGDTPCKVSPSPLACPAPGKARSSQRLLEQLQDPPVLIRPAVAAREAMSLCGVHRDLPVLLFQLDQPLHQAGGVLEVDVVVHHAVTDRSEEHTSELQSLAYLVCRLLLEKKKTEKTSRTTPGRSWWAASCDNRSSLRSARPDGRCGHTCQHYRP